jgi:hypothetical protein
LAITIKGFDFQGPSSVPPGARVTVTNMDSVAHTVTADDGTSFDITIKGGGAVSARYLGKQSNRLRDIFAMFLRVGVASFGFDASAKGAVLPAF